MQLYAGAFALYDTHGLPLSVIVSECRKRGTLVDWGAFVRDALRSGWSDKKINAVVEEARREAKEDAKTGT